MADETERWNNPCGIQTMSAEKTKDQIIEDIINAAERAQIEALKAKEKIVEDYYPDPEFETGTMHVRQNWLLHIPEKSEEHFKELDLEKALSKSYDLLQYFAVGLEQMKKDENEYNEGVHTGLYYDLENNMIQLLCDLQVGLQTLNVDINEVHREVMSEQARNMAKIKDRNMRDFLILRDYVLATEYIGELFAYLKKTDESEE